jgi:toxin CptA
LHGTGVVAIWVSDVDGIVKALLAMGLGASAVFSWLIPYRRAAEYSLIWEGAGHWSIRPRAGVAIRCETWDAPWIDPKIVVLRFRLGRWRRLTFVLCADSLPPDTHRHLRAKLLRIRSQP